MRDFPAGEPIPRPRFRPPGGLDARRRWPEHGLLPKGRTPPSLPPRTGSYYRPGCLNPQPFFRKLMCTSDLPWQPGARHTASRPSSSLANEESALLSRHYHHSNLPRFLMTQKLVLAFALSWSLFAPAVAQYDAWQHHGSLWILTTPEGADLPAQCSEADFPLLVRLDRGTFDFGQAKARGEDIRFTDGSGTPLAYQIEQWDAVRGTAAIWVRIPTVKGNARQEIRMYWGKADATSESSGSAVFNESNGYLSVRHMGDPVEDEVGTLDANRRRHDGFRGDDRQRPALRDGQGDQVRGEDRPLSDRRQCPHFPGLVPGRAAQCAGPRLGKRAGAGESDDAVGQPAARSHGLLLLGWQRSGRQRAADGAMGSRGAYLSATGARGFM